ncbi:DUF4089 domain-containing protein [Ramlibacter sp. H39-3-26]|uniref:DUF4089 domain-containing protein n=1 Tax=Curvibacter soli TaxID=3031331 RepID=UPI0023DAE269|nr:DUF4089 domain-containing protein [Ramlibacter sp. H39-3-26]MDF1484992.1 DUF4089 domain-containing protein [Ramlibacter sp. H39-3-26]
MNPETQEQFVDAAAAMLELPLHAEHRPGVLRYFALAAKFAVQLDAVPLAAHDDSAAAFVPVVPSGVQR